MLSLWCFVLFCFVLENWLVGFLHLYIFKKKKKDTTGSVPWCSILSLSLKCQHPILVLVQFPVVPLLIQLPANTWKGCAGEPKSLGPCIHMGAPEENPGSWLQTGPASTTMTIWGRQPADRRSVYFSFSLYNSSFQIKIIFGEKKTSVLGWQHSALRHCHQCWHPISEHLLAPNTLLQIQLPEDGPNSWALPPTWEI